MIYRVLLVFLVQLLFGTISFRSPKALLNVLIHLFYLFDLKWSLKCYLSAIIDQGDIYNRTFAWLLTKLVFECKLIHWEQRSSVIQATQKSASHVASHMSISQHDNQHDIQMPYFNSWTCVFLLKLFILSGTLKKSLHCVKFSLLCQVSNMSPITVVRKYFSNYCYSSLSRLSKIKLTLGV